jgi:hypothetical protein
MLDQQYFQDLLQLAQRDLSQAHLHQHFSTAKSFATAFGHESVGQGTWSSLKPKDTLTYTDGTVSGLKHWISGLDLCSWAIVPVKNGDTVSLAVLQKTDLKITPIPTQGLQNTLTVHFSCDQAPAKILGDRADPRTTPVDHQHHWGFITNHLGISLAVFRDVDAFSVSKYSHIKNKIKLDLEILYTLFNDQFDRAPDLNFDRDKLIYAFAKQVSTEVAQLVIEITGTGIYEIDHPNHQRYQDILIYCSHMKNLASALEDIKDWSV